MKVQHRSLQKQHVITEQHLHRMKIQIATMMQLQGSRADPAQLECLQSMLSEKNSEIQALKIKLCRPEKVEMTLKAQPSSAPVETDSGDGLQTLKMQLLNSVKAAERLGDELSMQRMKSLSESQRALELERKFFSVVRALKQSQSDNIKLQVKVEEFRLKYEPNGDSKCVRICEEPPTIIHNPPMSVSPWCCRPLSLLRCVNFGFLVFFLGFVRALTTRPPLPTFPLPFERAVTGKSLH